MAARAGYTLTATDRPVNPDLMPAYVPLADVQVRPVAWLVNQRLLRGDVTLWAGPSKVGKTNLVMCGLVAPLTTSRPTYFDTVDGRDDVVRAPCRVLWLSLEDGPADIKRRVQAAGGDYNYVIAPDLLPYERTYKVGAPEFGEFARRCQPDLIVIDSDQHFRAAQTDAKDQGDVTTHINCLRALASELNCAIILVVHTTKANPYKASSPRELIAGSAQYINGCKLVYYADFCSSDEKRGRRFLQTLKNSLAPEGCTLEYHIQSSSRNQQTPVAVLDGVPDENPDKEAQDYWAERRAEMQDKARVASGNTRGRPASNAATRAEEEMLRYIQGLDDQCCDKAALLQHTIAATDVSASAANQAYRNLCIIGRLKGPGSGCRSTTVQYLPPIGGAADEGGDEEQAEHCLSA